MPQGTSERAAPVRFETNTRELWWRRQGITRLVAGVFEGGGAKGVLYSGALEAMVEDPDDAYWFAAAAGASAGAITATLIAAGFRPDQVAEQTKAGLARLEQRATWRNALLRVRDGESYLDQEGLLEWLGELLGDQVLELTGEKGGETITFEELHDLTEVELDVIAVDLVRQRPVVFNYALTPHCQVADAVLASAAIPLAFECRSLWVPGPTPDKTPTLGMIVDGGVISNFPQWVFTDRSFREWAELEQVPASIPVVGFLLDEQGDSAAMNASVYRESFFFPAPWKFDSPDDFLNAAEKGYTPDCLKTRRFRQRSAKTGVGTKVTNALLRPLALLALPLERILLRWIPRFLQLNAGGERFSLPGPEDARVRTLPGPEDPRVRTFLRWYDALMTAIRPPVILIAGFVVATLALAYGGYRVAWLPLAHLVESAAHGETGALGAVFGLIVLLLASVVPIYAWMLLTVAFGGGWVFHRTIQRTGYGLLRTFLQNPAAPPWAGKADEDIVVRLPVPEGLTTLEANLTPHKLDAAIEDAREATREMLRSPAVRPVAGQTGECPLKR
jgi:predicted acylesterase/phospholipase RssA